MRTDRQSLDKKLLSPLGPSLRLLVLAFAIDLTITSPGFAQVSITTLEEMRSKLSKGDVISLVQKDGTSVTGQLLRFGNVDLDIRTLLNTRQEGRDIRIPRSAIQSLERKRDSTKDGAAIGATVGAGLGLWFIFLGTDPHKSKELGPGLAVGASTTAIGALDGWTIDSARSKPHLKFEASPEPGLKISVVPLLSSDR